MNKSMRRREANHAEKKLARSETSFRNHLGDSDDAVCVADERKTAPTFCEILLFGSLLRTSYCLEFADEHSPTVVAFS